MAPPTTTPPAHGDRHAPAASAAAASMQAMSSSLFWGDRAVVLFAGWPGARGLGSYLLCLLFVLALAALAEALHAVSAHVAQRWRRRGAVVPALLLLLTAVHAARMGAAYLLMLAVMSFNGGVLLAAVAGHALGFLLTRSWAARAEELEAGHGAGAGAGRGRDLVRPSDDAAKA